MNKTYTNKWNAALGAWVACSEISRRCGKTTAVVSLAVGAMAAQAQVPCTPAADFSYLPTRAVSPECDTINVASPVSQPATAGFFILSRKSATALNVSDFDVTAHVNAGYAGVGNQYGNPGGVINLNNVRFNFSTSASSSGNHSTAIGSHSNVTINAADVNITSSTGGQEAYGILAGSSVNAGEGSGTTGLYTTIALERLTLNQTTTSTKPTPALNSGLRAIQGAYLDSGEGSAGRIQIDDLDMTLKGRRIEGIYVSGAAGSGASETVSQVLLNNSKIVLDGDGSTADNQSSAIKIGKTRPVGSGKGLLVSAGRMEIDASAAIGHAIKLSINGSRLEANEPGSSADILANKSALAFGVDDWGTTAEATGITANFGAARLRTVSNTDALILVDGGQQDVAILFDRGSDLAAPANGDLIDIVNNHGATATPSTAIARFDQGTTLTGLTNKLADASLEIQLDNGSIWTLAEKSSGDRTATFNLLQLEGDSVLNAFVAGSNAAFELQGNVASNASSIRLTDAEVGDVLRISGNYTGAADAALEVDTCLGDDSAPSDRLVVDGSTSGDATLLRVAPNTAGAGCNGAATTGNGILVVEVTENSDAVFMLEDGPIAQGDYVYDLAKVGNNWYLQSALGSGQVTISKQVDVPRGSANFNGSIAYTLTCSNPANTFTGTITIIDNLGSSPPIEVPVGSQCNVEETLPPPPPGHAWEAPAYTQPDGPMPNGGAQTASIVNTLRANTDASSGGSLRAVPMNHPLGLVMLSTLVACASLVLRRRSGKQRNA